MGSKARPPSKHTLRGLAEGDLSSRPTSADRSTTTRLLGRIADALQVQPAVLYNPPNAVTAARGAEADDASSISLDQDCRALLHAYRRIKDPKERQRLLSLVQEAAEQI